MIQNTNTTRNAKIAKINSLFSDENLF